MTRSMAWADGAVRDTLGHLPDQIFKAAEALRRAVGVQRGEAAGVSGVPGLQQDDAAALMGMGHAVRA